ncbi:MAG: hypothetical protein K2Q10_14225, partial [Rhodospirillales bacterium]|nr:hypothetical protein [Rhodospirillales bacterium]
MDASVLEDDLMLQAVGILADSMDSLASPTSLALAVPARALRVVVATRSPHAFEMASRSFSLLDPAMRRQIANEAATAAHEAVQLRKAAA